MQPMEPNVQTQELLGQPEQDNLSMFSREVLTATGVPIHPGTVNRVQVPHQATTGVLLPAGHTLSLEVVPQAVAVVRTIVRAAHRAAAAVHIAGPAVPAEVAVHIVVRAAPAAVPVLLAAAPTVLGAAAAVRQAAVVAPIVPVAAVAHPVAAVAHRVAAAVVHRVAATLHPAQDVELSITAGIHSLIPAFNYIIKSFCYEKDFIYSLVSHMYIRFCGSTK